MWIFHVNAKADLTGDPDVDWASENIRQQVLEKTNDTNLLELESYLDYFLRHPPQNFTPPTLEYQRWATLKILCGTKLDICPVIITELQSANEFTFQLQQSTQIRLPFKTHVLTQSPLSVDLLSSQTLDTVHLSTTSNKDELCDAAALTSDGILLLLQMTIGTSHKVVTNNKLEAYVKEVQAYNLKVQDYNSEKEARKPLTPITKISLIFVVPYLPNFRLQSKELGTIYLHSKKTEKSSVDVTAGILELRPAFCWR